MRVLLLLAALFLGSCTDNVAADRDIISTSAGGGMDRIQLPDGWLIVYTRGTDSAAVCYVPGNLNWELKK